MIDLTVYAGRQHSNPSRCVVTANLADLNPLRQCKARYALANSFAGILTKFEIEGYGEKIRALYRGIVVTEAQLDKILASFAAQGLNVEIKPIVGDQMVMAHPPTEEDNIPANLRNRSSSLSLNILRVESPSPYTDVKFNIGYSIEDPALLQFTAIINPSDINCKAKIASALMSVFNEKDIVFLEPNGCMLVQMETPLEDEIREIVVSINLECNINLLNAKLEYLSPELVTIVTAEESGQLSPRTPSETVTFSWRGARSWHDKPLSSNKPVLSPGSKYHPSSAPKPSLTKN